jgi:hypothetical protein
MNFDSPQIVLHSTKIRLNNAGLLDQYHLGGFTVGGWVNQKLGQTFAPIKPQNEHDYVIDSECAYHSQRD